MAFIALGHAFSIFIFLGNNFGTEINAIHARGKRSLLLHYIDKHDPVVEDALVPKTATREADS